MSCIKRFVKCLFNCQKKDKTVLINKTKQDKQLVMFKLCTDLEHRETNVQESH